MKVNGLKTVPRAIPAWQQFTLSDLMQVIAYFAASVWFWYLLRFAPGLPSLGRAIQVLVSLVGILVALAFLARGFGHLNKFAKWVIVVPNLVILSYHVLLMGKELFDRL